MKWDQHVVYDSKTVKAVVVNSGVANACTGTEGYNSCQETAKAAAGLLGAEPDQILLAPPE